MRSPTRYIDRSPQEVLAVQLSKGNGPAVWEWADSKPFYGPDKTVTGLTIFTPHGRVKAEFGDWVVRRSDATFWVFSPSRFREEFTAVELISEATRRNLQANGQQGNPASRPKTTGVDYRCPGVGSTGHGLTEAITHASSCCDRFAALPAVEQAATGLRYPAATPQGEAPGGEVG